MKASDIKVGHIYYVNFDPTRKGEFDKKHLAVVIKKNANKITFVTVPLTSSDEGEGINKVSLGMLNVLPVNLRDKVSYAVYDQIRTVNADRFSELMENGKPIEVELPHDKLITIYKSVIKDLLNDVSKDMLLEIFGLT